MISTSILNSPKSICKVAHWALNRWKRNPLLDYKPQLPSFFFFLGLAMWAWTTWWKGEKKNIVGSDSSSMWSEWDLNPMWSCFSFVRSYTHVTLGLATCPTKPVVSSNVKDRAPIDFGTKTCSVYFIFWDCSVCLGLFILAIKQFYNNFTIMLGSNSKWWMIKLCK